MEDKKQECPECHGYGGVIVGDSGRCEPIWDSCPTCSPRSYNFEDFEEYRGLYRTNIKEIK